MNRQLSDICVKFGLIARSQADYNTQCLLIFEADYMINNCQNKIMQLDSAVKEYPDSNLFAYQDNMIQTCPKTCPWHHIATSHST